MAPSMTPRQRWKVWYRQWRIIRRECTKAHFDMMIYGTGCVMLKNEPDYIEYIPIQDITLRFEDSNDGPA
jgi:hypothetical protein